MNFTDGLIPPNWQWIWLAFAAVLIKTLWSAPWHMLKKPGILNLLLGASVIKNRLDRVAQQPIVVSMSQIPGINA